MRSRQVEFPPKQQHVAWLTPALIGFSVLCVVLCVILIYALDDGPFIGPWG